MTPPGAHRASVAMTVRHPLALWCLCVALLLGSACTSAEQTGAGADRRQPSGSSAGGGYSTVEDLARFADALLNHELLSPEYTELLITAKVESGPGAGYAYGFHDGRDADGNGFVGHGGGAPGMNGDLRIYPKSGYVVVVLANMDPPVAQRISDYLDPRLPIEG
jgi:D-alanyl-D-alanine carboxypeptidase